MMRARFARETSAQPSTARIPHMAARDGERKARNASEGEEAVVRGELMEEERTRIPALI